MNGVAYERPNSVSDALRLLDQAAGRGRVIAGGTDLILIQKPRIALGPVAEKPFRAREAEAYLPSQETSPEIFLEAARIASAEASPRTSLLRGGEVYRREMIRLYLRRTLQDLLNG